LTKPAKVGKFSEPPPPGEVPTVIVGVDPNYPPFAFMTPDGRIEGFDVDVLTIIGNRCGFKPLFKPWDWATIVEALIRGDIDLIASGMTVNAPRSEKVWFTIPYYAYTYLVVVKTGDNRSLDEILNSGGYIAVEIGSTPDILVTKLQSEGYNVRKLSVDSYPAAIRAVLDGRAVAAIVDSAFLYPYLKANPGLETKIRITGQIGPVRVYAYATRPEDKWLRDCINQELEDLMFSPLWGELLKKWNLTMAG